METKISELLTKEVVPTFFNHREEGKFDIGFFGNYLTVKYKHKNHYIGLVTEDGKDYWMVDLGKKNYYKTLADENSFERILCYIEEFRKQSK